MYNPVGPESRASCEHSPRPHLDPLGVTTMETDCGVAGPHSDPRPHLSILRLGDAWDWAQCEGGVRAGCDLGSSDTRFEV